MAEVPEWVTVPVFGDPPHWTKGSPSTEHLVAAPLTATGLGFYRSGCSEPIVVEPIENRLGNVLPATVDGE
jgi:hypothetical protein